MFSLFLFTLCAFAFHNSNTAILKCDFETPCNDFAIDSNWGLTDGAHPLPINHDHTLNTNAGHYLFYSPKSQPPFYNVEAEIETKEWVQLPLDRAVCFQMWYYTPRIDFPFTVQLVQGDDEQLTRIVASIPGKDPSINDWTLVKIRLPAEKFKLFIRLNTTTIPLAIDDLSIDVCDEPLPSPSEILYTCTFETSCINDFIPLSGYPYEWSIMKASDAVKVERQAPIVDYTYGNQSGHYALVPNSKSIKTGYVGYLALQTSLNITANESFCLNFYYYNYGRMLSGNLKIYAQLYESPEIVQQLWPPLYRQYIYASDKWTWGIVDLPEGYYSLLFRVDSTDDSSCSYAVDDISITSCAYPPATIRDDNTGLLHFSCDFDNLTLCGMETGDRFMKPMYNFTIETGETVPDRSLGPLLDHTTNSSAGGFSYWKRQLPFTSGDLGYLFTAYPMVSNLGMCIRFAYYVKSSVKDKNGTMLGVTTGGCFGTTLWSILLDDSQGWQVVNLLAPNVVCMETYYLSVYQKTPVAVAVAIDDFIIDQCNTFTTTTTVTSTTTTTITSPSPTTSTTPATTTVTSTTTSSTIHTTTTTSGSIISTTTTTTTTSKSNARRVFCSNGFQTFFIYFLFCLFLSLF